MSTKETYGSVLGYRIYLFSTYCIVTMRELVDHIWRIRTIWFVHSVAGRFGELSSQALSTLHYLGTKWLSSGKHVGIIHWNRRMPSQLYNVWTFNTLRCGIKPPFSRWFFCLKRVLYLKNELTMWVDADKCTDFKYFDREPQLRLKRPTHEHEKTLAKHRGAKNLQPQKKKKKLRVVSPSR